MSSIPINSIASTLSEDGRYESFEGSNITVDNILEQDKFDVEIEGNTLVNLATIKYPITSYRSTVTIDDNIIKGVSTLNDGAGFYLEPTEESIDLLKGKTVTLFLYGVQASSSSNIGVYNRTNKTYYLYAVPASTKKKDLIFTVEIPSDINNTDDLEIIIRNPTGTSSWIQLENKLMILEGDWTNKEVPAYFTGMKSVGQDDRDGHKIEITSSNKDRSLSNSKEIILNEPLRGLPNGIKDRIIKRNGQWVVERNCWEIILDGSEDEEWVINNPGHFAMDKKCEPRQKIDSIVLCDKICSSYNTEDREENSIWGGNHQGIQTNKFKSLEEGIDYLSENPITVVYQLETPIYEPLNISPTLDSYLDTTYVSINSNIPSNMKIIIDRTLNRATEAIEIAKTNPTIDNLSRARMWINSAKETIKKDELQNEINKITNVEGLNSIIKKDISSNVDVYLKPKNSLSMSLSTNYIVFEDYSASNDLYMDNAFNITVNSTLPYRLNSYLESEIQNEDGSSKISKELLHIKEDSDNEYKQFLGINQKLILKEDCEAGSSNAHNIDLRLKASTHDADIYKTVINFEVEQQ